MTTMINEAKRACFVSILLMTSGIAAKTGGNPDRAIQSELKFRRAAHAVEGSYIVVFNRRPASASGLLAPMADEHARRHHARVTHYYEAALQGFAAEMTEAEARLLSEEPTVAWVEENAVGQLAGVENASMFPNLDRIDTTVGPNNSMDGLYHYLLSGKGIHIYILDTGILATHSEFTGRLSLDFSNVPDGRGPTDCNGHGTAVASIAAGTSLGVAKGAILHSVRHIGCDGIPNMAQALEAINWVTAHHQSPAVANMSFEFLAPFETSLDTATDNLINAGVSVVIAAGNDSADACLYSPQKVWNALTVGATTGVNYQTVASISNQGNCVDLFAPGVSITGAALCNNICTTIGDGTSYAAPHVAGAAAMYLASNPTSTPANTASAIANGATQFILSNVQQAAANAFLYTGFVSCSNSICSDACVNLQTDPNNCGACGSGCSLSFNYCVAGHCSVCPANTTPCCSGSMCLPAGHKCPAQCP